MKGKILTLSDVLDTLAEYDVYNLDIMPNNLFGLCDSEKQAIYINNTKRKSTRVRSLIHELAHAYFFLTDRNTENTERNVRLIERSTYRSLK